jgi:hypothetical protein
MEILVVDLPEDLPAGEFPAVQQRFDPSPQAQSGGFSKR